MSTILSIYFSQFSILSEFSLIITTIITLLFLLSNKLQDSLCNLSRTMHKIPNKVSGAPLLKVNFSRQDSVFSCFSLLIWPFKRGFQRTKFPLSSFFAAHPAFQSQIPADNTSIFPVFRYSSGLSSTVSSGPYPCFPCSSGITSASSSGPNS